MEEKYPISSNNQQCIGPCYYKDTKIIHPSSLDEISNVPYNFCPVNTFVYSDPKSKKSLLKTIDKCYIPTANKTVIDKTLQDSIVTPTMIFSSEYFVKIYYKLNNFDDLLKWLDDNVDKPSKTKERVFDNSMIVYGSQFELIDDRLVTYVNDYFIYHISYFYNSLKKHIHYESNNFVFRLDDHNSKNKEQVKEYIVKKFLGKENIFSFLSKFLRTYKNIITNKNLSQILLNHMIDYILKKIDLTIK